MALESLDRSPPPFFRVGFAPLTKLIFFSALSVLLIYGDKQLQFTQPGQVAASVGDYFQNLDQAQKNLQVAQLKVLQQSARSQQVEQLAIENQSLRQLLDLKSTVATSSQVAEVLFDVPDPYNQRIVINKGQVKDVALGSPVIDAGGVVGQVTRVYPLTAEVTLLTDRDQSIPVDNGRTGML
jgi:rod shape-determining protein MreC